MFKSSTPLKNEVLKYFKETSFSHFKVLAAGMCNALKDYKDEEKIETVDRLVKIFVSDECGFKTALENLDFLCARESSVFHEASDYDVVRAIEVVKKGILEFRNSLADLVDKNPTNKNDIILLKAQKITLFDQLFRLTDYNENLQADFYYTSGETETVPQDEGEPEVVIEKVFVFTPLVDLYDDLYSID